MKKVSRLIALLLAVALAPALLLAQEGVTVTGRVSGAQGEPEAGVAVRIEALGIGATTTADGTYRLVIPGNRVTAGQTAQISVSRQGLGSMTRTLTLQPGATLTQNFTLQAQSIMLDNIVVSALGVARERSTLGTAQQQIGSEELNTTRSQSIVTQMQGKVSGVQITGGGTQGGSNNIVIRGANSISGDNQPLFIVDGIPVSNRNRGGGLGSGYDYGNAISDLNPEDIATVTVLKGPNAAAIYGSRAANGAIVITTKKGSAAVGSVRTEFTTSYTTERLSRLPDFQNEYGQGAAGQYGINFDQSWGPRLDAGLSFCQFNSPRDANGVCQATPWISHPNNVEDFFNTGTTSSTTLAFSGGSERANARVSFGYDDVNGVVPENEFHKYTASLNGAVQVSDRANVNGTVQYLRNEGVNRPGTGYNQSILEQFFWYGRQVDTNALRNYQGKTGAVSGGSQYANREFNWNYNYHNNPFWIQGENQIEDTRDRLLVSGTASYRLADGVEALLRSGSDLYTLRVEQRYAPRYINFTDPAFAGGFVNLDEYNHEHNSELLVTADRDITDALRVNAMVGGGIRREYREQASQSTNGLIVPGIYNVSNAAITPTLGQRLDERHVNSTYGSLAATWNDWFTLEGTARNDWSSTLPEGDNSYFYPSISTSIVLTDAVPALRNPYVTFAKIRGSLARVGNDASPYQLRTTFSGLSQQLNGNSQFTLGDVLANQTLKPELTTSTEFGVELEFMDGRAFVDASYYDKSTKDQIFTVPASAASGFASRAINAGEVTNSGFEALVGITPINVNNGLRWTTTFNYGQNDSKIVDLYEGVSTYVLGNSLFGDGRLEARVGQEFGAIYGTKFARDEATGKLLTDGGIPFTDGTFEYLGSISPDWTGGWSNEFAYRNVSFGFLFDIRRGGKIVSLTNQVGEYSGVLASSLRGREAAFDDPKVLVDGIDVDTGEPNERRVLSETYFQNATIGILEPYVFDGSFVKLREMRFGFDIPSRLAGRLGTENINVAITGRNLITWTDVPNIDPEFAYSSSNFQGFEYAIPANPRSVGISVRVRP